MTWSVQLAPNVSKDVADTDDERVVERWEPGEIISGDDEDEDEDDDVAKGEGRREDFLGRRTRSSIRRRKRLRRRERRPSAEVCRNIQGDTSPRVIVLLQSIWLVPWLVGRCCSKLLPRQARGTAQTDCNRT